MNISADVTGTTQKSSSFLILPSECVHFEKHCMWFYSTTVFQLFLSLWLKLLLCFPSATPCQTTHTGLCGQRGRTSVFSYQVRVEQVKQRPPRRSCSTTLSPAPLMITWLPLVTVYCSLTLFWRYLTVAITDLFFFNIFYLVDLKNLNYLLTFINAC